MQQIPPTPQKQIDDKDLLEVETDAARRSWGINTDGKSHTPNLDNTLNSRKPFSWPTKAIPIFTRAELNMMVGVIGDCHGFKTPEEKAPAHMTATLISSLLDGFAILAKADRLDRARHQLGLLEDILQIATETFQIVKNQPDSAAKEKSFFMRRAGFRIELAGQLLSELREFLR